MFTIRYFEKNVEKYFSMGKLMGTTHGYIGQEIIASCLSDFVDMDIDYVTSTHRCHGHYLALFDDVEGLSSEIMGKKDGVVNGLGGSQHIKKGNFITNGITGGMIPIGVGIAFSKKLLKEKGIVFSFVGDGGMNEGYVLEAFNLSSVYEVPIFFILENNHYALSTTTEKFTAGSFQKRIEAYDIKYEKIIADDPEILYMKLSKSTKYVRETNKPFFLEIDTFRFCGHSKSDKREYVDKELEKFWLNNDPLNTIKQQLNTDFIVETEKIIKERIDDAFEKAAFQKEMSIDEFIRRNEHEA